MSRYKHIKDIYSFNEGNELHANINIYNKNNNKTKINLYHQHYSDTGSPEIYLKEYNQLKIDEIEKFENDFN